MMKVKSRKDSITVTYKHKHFLSGDSFFHITFGDLSDFNLDVLDVSLLHF